MHLYKQMHKYCYWLFLRVHILLVCLRQPNVLFVVSIPSLNQLNANTLYLSIKQLAIAAAAASACGRMNERDKLNV